jgi:hypothetical protein
MTRTFLQSSLLRSVIGFVTRILLFTATSGVLGLILFPARADDSLLQKAYAQYRQAYHTGYITSLILFEHNTELRYVDTPARAVPNFAEGTCTVYLSPESVTKLGFDQGSRLRFMVFHEMAHCDLYYSLTTIQAFPELPLQANLLLSDLLEIEYLFPHNGARHLNGYIAYHELYADIKAMALMLNEGAVWDDIEPIWLFRRSSMASVIGGHDSERLLMQMPFHMAGPLLPMKLDSKVRMLTDRHIVNSFIEKVFAPLPLHFAASRQLEGGLRTICSSLKSQWASQRDIAFLKRRLWEGANSPKSLWQDVAFLMQHSTGCTDFIERFFLHRYDLPVQHLSYYDTAIAAWLSTDK